MARAPGRSVFPPLRTWQSLIIYNRCLLSLSTKPFSRRRSSCTLPPDLSSLNRFPVPIPISYVGRGY